MSRTIVFLLAFFTFAAFGQANPTVYKVGKNEYEGYVINKGKSAPVIFLVHDWDGLTDYEIKRAEMLGEKGYSVFAVDLFGKGVRPQEMDERRRLTGELYENRAQMRKLMDAARNEAKKAGLNINKSVVMGYCFGGAVALEWVRSGVKLSGTVSFHGGLETPDGQNYKKAKGQILVLHGTSDTAVSMDDFAELAQELDEAKVTHEMITYSGAPHAFTVFGSPAYRKDADQKSWDRFLKFLEEVLK
jgi:dienelactone hydrolase